MKFLNTAGRRSMTLDSGETTNLHTDHSLVKSAESCLKWHLKLSVLWSAFRVMGSERVKARIQDKYEGYLQEYHWVLYNPRFYVRTDLRVLYTSWYHSPMSTRTSNNVLSEILVSQQHKVSFYFSIEISIHVISASLKMAHLSFVKILNNLQVQLLFSVTFWLLWKLEKCL